MKKSMESIRENEIGQLVAKDYRSALVFRKYGIDFCCKGNRTLNEVCSQMQLDPLQLEAELETLHETQENDTEEYWNWPLDVLADHIEHTHHRYVEQRIPVLKQYLEKLCKVHGKKHLELFSIRDLFEQCAAELSTHMKKEELILFPFIRKMVASFTINQVIDEPHFRTVGNPIQMMKEEHDLAGDIFRRIAKLSSDYMPPKDACETYKVTFALLREFEEDLHLHIHLENNLLFPKAEKLEKELVIKVS